jgi:hypothetical protein
MDGMVERIAVFAVVGLGSGFASGLFGIGGGIIRRAIAYEQRVRRRSLCSTRRDAFCR